MQFRIWVLCACAPAALAGCASTASRNDFTRVQAESQQRLGSAVSWNTNSADDVRANEAVDRLLASQLSIDAAVQIALLNNPSLQARFEEIGIAQADLVQAGLLKNPMFDAAYEFAAGGGKAKINLSVTEDFLSLLAIPLRKKMAERTLDAARERVAAAVIEVADDTRKAFIELQAAEQLQELHETALKSANAATGVAHSLHHVGNINDLDMMTQDVDAGMAMLAFTGAQADVVDKRAALNEQMGLADDRADRWSIANHLPDASTTQPTTQPITQRAGESWEARAVNDRSDVSAARHDVEAQAQGLGIARQFALLPDASAGASAEREHDGTWETGPSVSVPIPLFDTGNAQVAAAAARWRQSKRQYESLIVQVHGEVRRAVNHVALASASVKYLHDSVLPLRDRIVHETLLQYNGMAMSVFQLLAAKSAEVDAGRMYVEALRDYWLARVELDRAVGGTAFSKE